MTSVKKSISQEARNLLADAYKARKQPWFAAVVLNDRLGQFDPSLEVITQLLDNGEKTNDV